MSELEFQRELSPEQMREALSLLDSTTGEQNQNSQVGVFNPAEEVDPEADQSSTTIATQDRPPPSEHPRQPKKPENMAVAYYGLGIAAAHRHSGALVMVAKRASASAICKDRSRGATEPAGSPPGIIASPPPPVATAPPGQNSGGSEPRFATPEVADSSPIEHASRDNDQGAVSDRAYSDGAAPYAAGPGIVPAMATREARRDEKTSRKPGPARWHAWAVRVATAKKRLYRQARAEMNGSTCFFLCLPWSAQLTISYEPPRNMTQ